MSYSYYFIFVIRYEINNIILGHIGNQHYHCHPLEASL